MKALFLSDQHALTAGGGGQQQCTREYVEVLRRAGFDLVDVLFSTDRALPTRLRRRLLRVPYADIVPKEFFSRVLAAVAEHRPEFVFCNLYNLIPLGPRLRERLPRATKVVLLSHGLASVDEVHAGRIASQPDRLTPLPPVDPARVGRMLALEADALPSFDHVFCLAPFEVEICRWLGARSVSWCPRVLESTALIDWNPTGDRVGIIGTLDHPPNLDGVEQFCAALSAAGPGRLRLRLITRSSQIAAALKKRHAFVDDLGPLERRDAVEAEAGTWSAFVHPVFCFAMGCSTKVATGLSWGLPVLTTAAGLRGYVWKDGRIPTATTAAELAALAIEVMDTNKAAIVRGEALRIARSGPSVTDVAMQVRGDLNLGSKSSGQRVSSQRETVGGRS
jgi:hypothetical protein